MTPVNASSLSHSPHKQAIAHAFGRAAGDYDRFAALQRESGEQLMALVGDHAGSELLDAGCGTGYFSARWQASGKQVTALDLSTEMLAIARQRRAATHYLQGDIEHLPLADGSVDISFSNMAMQWCDDFDAGLAELYRVTRPGGAIAICTLAQGTLAELDAAWRQLDGSRRINRFLSLEAVVSACRRYHADVSLAPVTCYFPDVLSLMRSVKGVGATWLRDGREHGGLSRRHLTALTAHYDRHPQGYPLTYQRVFGVIYRD
ncbi:malonyl-ACP O-methyltransferase BioC [Dickeya dianthicola]|uniref:malonyl-ACP O-methyltransferase BioC n=1 Tax=Dickeya dianthicola TaxID=204039 RepID=UPI00136818DB|nr:malonyl-ACP O-methyltransferase BioC [Dickeya dianthicola]MCI4235570.1 malonyl-ACP O-methyltransferase BioC [Dickeya dianthicola]MCI4255844.1 malonyl-ACP O-methyltransferase BioC [Dickeya dianthicola]MZG22074.1 malonyl-ACP O-methyltransferase BioC [Dickeya dianthicola]MZI87861.1 malonyl-ACP O-methyltransferase BioC [Dickeya dianthicola]